MGINNIPPKICSYSCAYCQLGPTIKMQIEREVFYKPEEILNVVNEKVKRIKKAKETIDYLTFVPDGEPTLDINIEHEIDLLKSSGIPIAVITNSSLIWQKDVRNALMKADWVSLKVDTVEERYWRKINRPHRLLKLDMILNGALNFAKAFKGKLMTETMLLAEVNGNDSSLKGIADFLALLQPDTAYISIPTRPPAEKWVQPPDEYVMNKAYQIFKNKIKKVEYLSGYEGNAFAFTGNAEEDLLSITAVHPMRDDAIEKFLKRAGTDWTIIDRMLAKGLMVEKKYGENKFYLRKFNKKHA
ncbi:MAG: radical SAM protein [Desulfobacterales bacterium]